MLSPFLRKLMFAREFSIMDGEAKILGEKYSIIDSELLFSAFEKIDSNKVTELSKKQIENIASKIGTKKIEILEKIPEIYESFGLGKLNILKLDTKKKNCIVELYNLPTTKNIENFSIVAGSILSGYFFTIFEKKMKYEKKIISTKIQFKFT